MPRTGGHNRGKGRGLIWLKDNVNYSREACLLWPWSKNHQGYGQLGYNGKVHKAHRIMCILRWGDPPSPIHDAAHSCGNGHLGCVNPEHLSWKTSRENRKDTNDAGTDRNHRGKRLPSEIVRKIKESPKPYLEIANEFNVYFGTVGKIKRGELYPEVGGRPLLSAFTDEEIAAEYYRRSQAKLGDPRIVVGFAGLPDHLQPTGGKLR